MLSISPGHHWQYLTSQVGKGRENYYTNAYDSGEPPGIWQGDGAVDLGLSGEVTEAQMAALYGHFVDPRDPGFNDPAAWETAEKLGQPPRTFRSRDEILAGMLAAEPDATPERVEELTAQAQKQARSAVAFIDLTFSPPKSVSVLHTAFRAQEVAAQRAGDEDAAAMWRGRAEQVEAAVWAGNNAMLDYMQREAGFSRSGYHGSREPGRDSVGKYVDAHRWTIASFFQHTARPTAAGRGEQPNLHIHNAVLNRVECPDGKWRTLDSRGIHKVRGAAGSLAERAMFEQLTDRLGLDVRMRPDGKAREVHTVPERVRDWFSARRQAVTERTATYVELFKNRKGREPNALELARLAAKATVDSREPKLKRPTTAEQRLDRWTDEVRREVDETLADIAERSVDRVPDAAAAAGTFDPQAVVAAALADVQSTKSKWTRYDLLRAIDNHLPDNLGGVSAATFERVREELADQALTPLTGEQVAASEEVWRLTAPEIVEPPVELRRSDGTTMYRPHGSDQYATREQLTIEEELEEAARVGAGAPAVTAEQARELLDAANAALALDGGQLGDDQAAALAGILTSGRQVETLIGPAGTGKSFVLGQLAEMWEEQLGHGRVFGLALAHNAANVLAEEGLTDTENIAQWLRTQEAISAGQARPEHEMRWGLSPGDLIVIDESGMADTASLAEVRRRAAEAGAKVLFVGDDRQLSAVGAGGALRLVAEAGTTYRLSEVRRFRSEWERSASLRLRNGETDVLRVYERHGRLVDAGTAEQAGTAAARAWLTDTLAGRESLIVVDTNEQAADIAGTVQAELVRLGRVQEPAVALADGNRAGVGDVIQARRNDRRLRSSAGTWVVNRQTYRVLATAEDGSVEAQRIIGRTRRGTEKLGAVVTLPPEYVAGHATLAYATTAHGAQGRTVDTCHAVITRRTGADAEYVDLTRGRRRNIAYVVTEEDADWRTPEGLPADAPAPLAPGEERPTPMQVLTGVMERYEPDVAAIEYLRQELADSVSLRRLGAIWTSVQQDSAGPRYEEILRDVLPGELAERAISEDASGPLWRLVRAAELAGHDARTLLQGAASERDFADAESVAKVLHWRITNRHGQAVIPQEDTYAGRTISGDSPLPRYAQQLAEVMDARVEQLGEQALTEPAPWLTDAIGPAPADRVDAVEWSQRAGRVLAYREQYGYDGDRDAIGPAPSVANPEARAGWYAAWRALGSPETRTDEATQNEAQLQATISAYEREEAWAPQWVGEQLRDTAQAAQGWQERAYLTAAEARIEPDAATRKQLHIDAQRYARIARELVTDRGNLEQVDQVRGEWYLATADERAAADRARQELRRRGTVIPPEAQQVSAQDLARSAVLRDMVTAGVITDEQSQQITADPAARAMWTAVDHAAAGAGRDPRDVLTDAVASRELGTAESVAKVLHYRVRGTAETQPTAAEPEQTEAEQTAAQPTAVDQPAAQREHATQPAPGTEQHVDRDAPEADVSTTTTVEQERTPHVAEDEAQGAPADQAGARAALDIDEAAPTQPQPAPGERRGQQLAEAFIDAARAQAQTETADAPTAENDTADRRTEERVQKHPNGTVTEQAQALGKSARMAAMLAQAAEARRILQERRAAAAEAATEAEDERRRLEAIAERDAAQRDGPTLSR